MNINELKLGDFGYNPNADVKISAQIVDVFGEGIPSATVVSVLNNTNYAIADLDGYFSITIRQSDSLSFSSVGYLPITAGLSQILSKIVLQFDTLNEVVLPDVKKKSNAWKWFLGIGTTIAILAFKVKATGLAGASTTCNNRSKCTGLHKDGTLKKGYRFGKGGKVIKAKSTKSRTSKKNNLSGSVDVIL